MMDIDKLESLARYAFGEHHDSYQMHNLHDEANPAAILALIAEVRALREDKARLDWIETMTEDHAAVWMLPCGESLRFIQVRHSGECENYPTVEGLRNAIDAARKESA